MDEEEVVVNMMSGPIDQMDQGSRNSVVPIMYRNGPDVDEDKERNIDHLWI